MKQRKDQRGAPNSTVHVMKLLYRHSPRTVSNKQRESKLKSRFPRNSTDTGKEVSFLVTRGAETARERKIEREERSTGVGEVPSNPWTIAASAIARRQYRFPRGRKTCRFDRSRGRSKFQRVPGASCGRQSVLFCRPKCPPSSPSKKKKGHARLSSTLFGGGDDENESARVCVCYFFRGIKLAFLRVGMLVLR